MANTVIFKAFLATQGDRRIINIPTAMYEMTKDFVGKYIYVTLEEIKEK